MDPECICTGYPTISSDVYSFGVVLLELLTGHTAMHRDTTGYIHSLVDLASQKIRNGHFLGNLDQRLPPPASPSESDAVRVLHKLARACLREKGRDGPSMIEVVRRLSVAMSKIGAPGGVITDSESNASQMSLPKSGETLDNVSDEACSSPSWPEDY